MVSPSIFLAALGITVLEMSEASAVGIALYAESHRKAVYLSVALGVLTIFIPTSIVGKYIALLPIMYVRLISATLLLYFGLRLVKSSRRSVKFSLGIKDTRKSKEELDRGLIYTSYSVGMIEAFEAAIVLVALYPNGYLSTMEGMISGVVLVIIFAAILQSQVRKVKQAVMKIAVSSLLLTFSSFWYVEAFISISDLYLIPLFVMFFLVVYVISHWNLTMGSQSRSDDQRN